MILQSIYLKIVILVTMLFLGTFSGKENIERRDGQNNADRCRQDAVLHIRGIDFERRDNIVGLQAVKAKRKSLFAG